MASIRPETSAREGKTQREGTSTSAENEALVSRYVEEVYDQRKLEVVTRSSPPISPSTIRICRERNEGRKV